MLDNLLSIEATKSSNYPTLDQLLDNPFFSNALGPEMSSKKNYLKFSAGTKEALVKHRQLFEKRLEEDHKKFRLLEKEKKRRDVLNDENRKKKRQSKVYHI